MNPTTYTIDDLTDEARRAVAGIKGALYLGWVIRVGGPTTQLVVDYDVFVAETKKYNTNQITVAL